MKDGVQQSLEGFLNGRSTRVEKEPTADDSRLGVPRCGTRGSLFTIMKVLHQC